MSVYRVAVVHVCVFLSVYVTYTLPIGVLEGARVCVCLSEAVGVSSGDRPDSHLIYTYPNFYKLSAGLVWSLCVCMGGCVKSVTRYKLDRADSHLI